MSSEWFTISSFPISHFKINKTPWSNSNENLFLNSFSANNDFLLKFLMLFCPQLLPFFSFLLLGLLNLIAEAFLPKKLFESLKMFFGRSSRNPYGTNCRKSNHSIGVFTTPCILFSQRLHKIGLIFQVQMGLFCKLIVQRPSFSSFLQLFQDTMSNNTNKNIIIIVASTP